MTETLSRPRAYLLRSCPFCLRLRLFLTEAGLADGLDYEVFDAGDATHQSLRQQMEAVGQQPSFPAVEFQRGQFATGTDALIARFASPNGIEAASLPLLAFYTDGVFKRYGEMFRELRELKAA